MAIWQKNHKKENKKFFEGYTTRIRIKQQITNSQPITTMSW